ncbi:hypothetical protein BDDG_03474 [Blastomyces dermatitidis ATCC 18188]|uniref:Protein kinase domain-containing protein n=1 Tax=Ajellomyces dermatitidis (strain ATCC 18188 / CBS 674.68) TaxID=653446 RepID=F2TBE6_AJEDA|nr:hypothetical protein BDDG_03474 [Blastomyces dermatitidis ATCC 18188]
MLHGKDDIQYNWINGAESLEKYKPGGYHPIMIGDMAIPRGGQTWFWRIFNVGIANSHPHESKILRALWVPQPSSLSTHPGRKSIPLPLDEFELRGPNGTHPCYTMTPARCNLREKSLSAACFLLNIFYLDIHLRNVLVKLPSSFDQLPIEQLYETYGKPQAVPITRDFGEAFSPASNVRLGENSHMPLAMRPPEARFEPQSPLSFSADIWSLAVTIWEILGMKAIFSRELITADEIVSQQIDVLGTNALKEDRDVWPPINEAFEEGIQGYRRKRGMGVFEGDETAAILDLMRRMLVFPPEQRPTAEEVLESEWMRVWPGSWELAELAIDQVDFKMPLDQQGKADHHELDKGPGAIRLSHVAHAVEPAYMTMSSYGVPLLV